MLGERMPFPNPPARIVPFESGPVAAHDIGRQFDEHAKSVRNVIDFLRTIVRDDGVVKNHTIGPEQLRKDLPEKLAANAAESAEALLAEVRLIVAGAAGGLAQARRMWEEVQQYQTRIAGYADEVRLFAEGVRTRLGEIETLALAPPAPTLVSAPAPTGVLGSNAGNPMAMYSADDPGGTAVASDYAQVSIEWAEHMPDTIPPNILAINAITGDHWSSRWWANRAASMFGGVIAWTYLGPFPTPPTATPTGDPLQAGMLYYNTISETMFVWNGSAWEPMSSVGILSNSLIYHATAGQTVFSLSTLDLNGKTGTLLSTTNVEVFRNGVWQPPGSYTLNPGANTITLGTPAALGEAVGFVLFDEADVAPEFLPVVDVASFQLTSFPASAMTYTIPAYYSGNPSSTPIRVRRVDAQPTHPWKFRSADRFLSTGVTDATNGGWWEGYPSDGVSINATQFGAVVDGATDDYPAYANAVAYINAHTRRNSLHGSLSPTTWDAGGLKLVLGFGNSYLSQSLTFNYQIIVEGISGGFTGYGANCNSSLTFASNSGGLIFDFSTSTGSAQGSILQNCQIMSRDWYITANPDPSYVMSGVIARTAITIKNVRVSGFRAHGIYFAYHPPTGGGYNTIASRVDHCVCDHNRIHGISIGESVNAGQSSCIVTTCCELYENGQFALNDASSFGGTHIGNNTFQNGGFIPGFSNTSSFVNASDGQSYYLAHGQEANAYLFNPVGNPSVWNLSGAFGDQRFTPPWGVVTYGGALYAIIPGQESNFLASQPDISPAVWSPTNVAGGFTGSSGTSTITYSGTLPYWITQGMTVADLTTGGAIPASTTINSISGSVITLSAALTGNVLNTDTIAFTQTAGAGVPVWSSGFNPYVVGGHATTASSGNGSVFLNCYREGGDGLPYYSGAGVLVIGGQGNQQGNRPEGGGTVLTSGITGSAAQGFSVTDQPFTIHNTKGTAGTIEVIFRDTAHVTGGVMGVALNAVRKLQTILFNGDLLTVNADSSAGTNAVNAFMGLTGPDTTAQFGTGVNLPKQLWARGIALGSAGNANFNTSRILTYGSAAPSSGTHAAGEIVFNFDFSTPAKAMIAGWQCVVTGSPGTWETFFFAGSNGYTINSGASQLPAAAAVLTGAVAYVTDANGPTWNMPVSGLGGGSTKARVWCDGGLWRFG